ncbi:MAG: D-tyrosyl-tRNA(Tyr) deacylase [Saprospiraceae bacterium]|jgi:D-tyrosyl-tRNA(Tyr) deacylase|nr:D-tyrosyl-tRNA(Tyr) deacylase [Saprospiraceae bacterium]MBK9564295.1 D-tyrosyl-tRNA(Tyr) deacylase [Saprospiraceae bacterium]MBP6447749.1 D-tyrosyl-tRNA(Tyr) deacylase [Saprospiraceae bacterium]
MRVVIQRVLKASVTIDDTIHSEIDKGLLVLLGIEKEDTLDDATWLALKLSAMRIFSDEDGKMNLSISEVENGEFLVVSQFTLHASTKKGNRPSFIKSAHPDIAIPLYEYFCKKLKDIASVDVKTGVFAADMKVSLLNDGPVTIIMDSKTRE